MHFGIDGWRIDVIARSAKRGECEELLSPRAVRLLQVFAGANGAVLTRIELLDRVWPNLTVSDESLTQVVLEIRRKLANRKLIATVPRGGYRLTVPVIATANEFSTLRERPFTTLPLDAYTLCIEAQECLERGGEADLSDYFNLAAEAAAYAPNSAEARALNAEALFKRHLYWSGGEMLLEAALTEADAAIRIDPSNPKGYLFDGASRIAAGWLDRGFYSVEMALALGREDPNIHLDAAKLMFTVGNSRAAAALAVRAARLAPEGFEADFLAARVLMPIDPHRSRVHAERALRKVRIAMTEEPLAMRPLYTLGPLLAMLGDHRAALSTIEGISHHDSPLEYNRILALAQVGDVSLALERLEFLGMRGWRHSCVLDKETCLRPLLDDPRFVDLDRELQAV